jgi:hypothetical protein
MVNEIVLETCPPCGVDFYDPDAERDIMGNVVNYVVSIVGLDIEYLFADYDEAVREARELSVKHHIPIVDKTRRVS